MSAEDGIITPQVGAHPDGNRLLADISMASAVHQAALVRARQLFLAQANELHLTIKFQPQ